MNIKQQFTEVEFGQQKVKVPKGGYYDRFRMHPDLDEIAQDPAAGNIDFFRHIPKKLWSHVLVLFGRRTFIIVVQMFSY